MPGVGEVEPGESVRSVTEHADIERLEPFQGRRYVQDRLHARADDEDRRPRQRVEVGRLVPGLARVPVDAAEAAGREDGDAGAGGQVRRRGNCGRGRAAPTGDGGQITHARLDDVVAAGDPGQRGVVEADVRVAVDDSDRGRRRSAGADVRLDVAGDLQVLGTG